MSEELFRKQATDAFYGTEARGGVLTIAPPWSLVVFGAMALLFVALLTVAALGKAQVYAPGHGVVEPDQPPVIVRAPISGTLASVEITPNARGERGKLLLAFDVATEETAHAQCVTRLAVQQDEYERLQKRLGAWEQSGTRDAAMALVVIAESRQARDKLAGTRDSCDHLAKVIARSRVTFPVDARVDTVAVAAGSEVHEGDVLATLTPETARLVGYVTVPEAYRGDLAVGKPVRLKFDALPYDAVGAGAGRITRVLDALPPGVKLEGPSQVYAEVTVDRMPEGSSARPGMTFVADVFVREQRVSALLFGSGGAR